MRKQNLTLLAEEDISWGQTVHSHGVTVAVILVLLRLNFEGCPEAAFRIDLLSIKRATSQVAPRCSLRMPPEEYRSVCVSMPEGSVC